MVWWFGVWGLRVSQGLVVWWFGCVVVWFGGLGFGV